jgi:hypothetical protein
MPDGGAGEIAGVLLDSPAGACTLSGRALARLTAAMHYPHVALH